MSHMGVGLDVAFISLLANVVLFYLYTGVSEEYELVRQRLGELERKEKEEEETTRKLAQQVYRELDEVEKKGRGQ